MVLVLVARCWFDLEGQGQVRWNVFQFAMTLELTAVGSWWLVRKDGIKLKVIIDCPVQ